MNGISWFLYAAGVVDNLGGVMCGLGVFCFIACAVCWFGFALSDDKTNSTMLKGTATWLPYAGGAILLIGCFMPSKATVYAIAASQVGERVAQSEQVQGIADDATKALQQWIKKQIEPEAKK